MDAAYVAGKDSRMKYFGGCDAGSTYTKCVIIDENGKILAAVTKRSRINPVLKQRRGTYISDWYGLRKKQSTICR